MFRWSAILTMALGLFAGIPVVLAQLAAVQPPPYTAASGYFPRWYKDSTGKSLELCLSKARSSRVQGSFMCTLLPTPGIFDDTKPVVFPGNFPNESFWMLAETSIDDPGNGLELEAYVAGIEAAFANEVPTQGDQQSFARIRIRATVPVAGTYTVTHPYGVETFKVTTPGRKAINLTRDIGIGTPGNFDGALAGNIGPFLTRAAGILQEFNPDTGKVETFIGDPNLAERVSGSPSGNNFVRITGPNGLAIQTDVFNLSGKLFAGGASSKVGVDRATYSRNDQGTWISIFANASKSATLCFRESLDLAGNPQSPCQFQMAGDGNGLFFGQDLAPASLPPFVLITAKDAAPSAEATTQTQALTDIVDISQARYSWPNKTLTVEASSSDEVQIPTMLAEGFGRLLPGSGVSQRLVARNIAQPPATITVKSTAGGVDTEPVVIEGSPTTQPAGSSPLANPDSASTIAGVAVAIDVLANDSDPNGNQMSIASVSQPPTGRGSVSTSGTMVTYTPPDMVTTAFTTSFTYQVRNSSGALSTPTTVTITVSPGNQPPTAANDLATTRAGVPVTINVLVNDSDPDGNPMTVFGLSPLPVGRGTASTNGTTVIYTPPATVTTAFTTSFTYQVRDSSGAQSAPATVTLTVSPANQAPQANADSSSTSAGVPVAINVLTNDSDPDGDVMTVANLSELPAGRGTISTNGTSVTYTPPSTVLTAFTASFTYQARDASGMLSTPATVTIAVRPNRPPTASPDSASTRAGVPVIINVLANDIDPDGNTMSVVNLGVLSGLVNGLLGLGTVSTNGTTVTYTPPSIVLVAFTASFTYQARDSIGALSTPTSVTVMLRP